MPSPCRYSFRYWESKRGRSNRKTQFKLTADLVTLTATVFDDKGRYVSDLKKEDFIVLEDGVPQQICFFKSDELVPLSIGVLFDTSGSMVDKIDGVQDAVKHFIDTTKPSDEVFLMRFSNDVRLFVISPIKIRGCARPLRALRPMAARRCMTRSMRACRSSGRGRTRKRRSC